MYSWIGITRLNRWTHQINFTKNYRWAFVNLWRLTVRGDVNFIRQLSYIDLKAVLDIVQSLGISLIRHKGYSQAFGAKPTSTGHLVINEGTSELIFKYQISNDKLIELYRWASRTWRRQTSVTTIKRSHMVISFPNSHPVQIGVRIFWHVIIEDNVDPLNVHPSAEEISGHQDPPLKILELLIARQSE